MKEIKKTEGQIKRKINLAIFFFSAVIYLLLAFITWEISFSEWSTLLRFFFAFLIISNTAFWMWGKGKLLEEKRKQEEINNEDNRKYLMLDFCEKLVGKKTNDTIHFRVKEQDIDYFETEVKKEFQQVELIEEIDLMDGGKQYMFRKINIRKGGG